MSFVDSSQDILQWRHNECDGVSNHRCLDCLLNSLYRPQATRLCCLYCQTALCACRKDEKTTNRLDCSTASMLPSSDYIWCRRKEMGTSASSSFEKQTTGSSVKHIELCCGRVTQNGKLFCWQSFLVGHIVSVHNDVINGTIFRVTGHLCGEFTSHRWIPHTKASDAELWCFLWSAPE